MALSMDEQRMLAEIERRLSAEDPGLAARLSSFRRPGPSVRLRSTRGKVIGSLLTIALVAVVALMVYAMVPFRAHTYKPAANTQASSRPAASAQVRSNPAAKTGAAKAGAAKTGTTTHPATSQSTSPNPAG
jgi:cytoskeletal protein RodZ